MTINWQAAGSAQWDDLQFYRSVGSIIPQIRNATEQGLLETGFSVNSTNIFLAPTQADIVEGFAAGPQLDVDAGGPGLGPNSLT